jgi:hypothetical protein
MVGGNDRSEEHTVDASELRAVQSPLKQHYREDPALDRLSVTRDDTASQTAGADSLGG